MAEEYNLEGLRTASSRSIDDVQDKFTDVLDNDFLVRVARMASTSHSITPLRNAIRISIDSLGDIDTILQSALDDIGDLVMPERPEELSETVDRDREHVFLSDRLDTLAVLANDVYTQEIGNTGYSYDGMPADKIEALSFALYSTGYDQEEDNLKEDVDTLAGKWASDGYESAPGALSYGVAKMINAFDAKIDSGIGSPTALLAKSIQENIQWAFENGIAIEKLHMDFAEKSTRFKYEHISAIVKAYLGEIEKIGMEINLPIQNINTILDAAATDTSVAKKEVELTLDRELAHFTNWAVAASAKASAGVGLLKKQAEIIGSTVDGYTGLFSSYGNLFSGVTVQEQSVEED